MDTVTATPTRNKQVVQGYMDAYGRFDHETILSLLADDVVWEIPGAFVKSGKAAFDAEIEAGDPAGPPAIEISRLTEEGDVVIAEGSVRAGRRDGSVLHLRFCDVFELRGGLIARLCSYLVPVPEGDAR